MKSKSRNSTQSSNVLTPNRAGDSQRMHNRTHTHPIVLALTAEVFERENVCLREQNNELRSQANKSKQEIAKLRQDLKETNKEVNDLKVKLENAEDRNIVADQFLKPQLAKLMIEVRNLELEIAQSEREKRLLKDRFDQATRTSSDGRAINNLKLELGQAVENNISCLDENKQLSQQVKNSGDHISQMAKTLNKQGIQKFKSKQYEDALELYFKAIGIEEVGGNNLQWLGKVWYNISACWSGLKRVDKALETIGKAIACDSSHAGYFYGRGTYYKKLGDHENAVVDFKKSLELDPTYKNAEKNLAKLKKKKK